MTEEEIIAIIRKEIGMYKVAQPEARFTQCDVIDGIAWFHRYYFWTQCPNDESMKCQDRINEMMRTVRIRLNIGNKNTACISGKRWTAACKLSKDCVGLSFDEDFFLRFAGIVSSTNKECVDLKALNMPNFSKDIINPGVSQTFDLFVKVQGPGDSQGKDRDVIDELNIIVEGLDMPCYQCKLPFAIKRIPIEVSSELLVELRETITCDEDVITWQDFLYPKFGKVCSGGQISISGHNSIVQSIRSHIKEMRTKERP